MNLRSIVVIVAAGMLAVGALWFSKGNRAPEAEAVLPPEPGAGWVAHVDREFEVEDTARAFVEPEQRRVDVASKLESDSAESNRRPRTAHQGEWDLLNKTLRGTIRNEPWGDSSDPLMGEVLAHKEVALYLVDRGRQERLHRLGTATTDEEGHYAFELSALRLGIDSAAHLGHKTLYLCCRDLQRQVDSSAVGLRSILSQERPEADFLFELSENMSVHGRILDSSGAPIVDAVVHVRWRKKRHSTTTDEGGRFAVLSSVPAVPHERPTGESRSQLKISCTHGSSTPFETLQASSPLGTEDYRLDIPDAVTDAFNVGDLVFDRPPTHDHTVFGTLLSQKGAPLPHWPVFWQPNSGSSWSASFQLRTDDQGEFALAGHVGSLMDLYVSSYELVDGRTVVRAPASGITLQMREPTVSIRFRDPDGAFVTPKPGWKVYTTSIHPDTGQLGLEAELKVSPFFYRDQLNALVPEPGIYGVRRMWPGIRGQWRVDETFEVREGHQEIELSALYRLNDGE